MAFSWAGAQQQGFSLDTGESWQATLGAQTLSTSTVTTPSQTFVGWQTASLNFTATAASEVLALTAKDAGGSDGKSPWGLINNLTLNDISSTPEPGTLGLLALGLPLILRRKRNLA